MKKRESERMEMRVKTNREESEQREGWRVEVKPVAFRAIVAVNFFPRSPLIYTLWEGKEHAGWLFFFFLFLFFNLCKIIVTGFYSYFNYQ